MPRQPVLRPHHCPRLAPSHVRPTPPSSRAHRRTQQVPTAHPKLAPPVCIRRLPRLHSLELPGLHLLLHLHSHPVLEPARPRRVPPRPRRHRLGRALQRRLLRPARPGHDSAECGAGGPVRHGRPDAVRGRGRGCRVRDRVPGRLRQAVGGGPLRLRVRAAAAQRAGVCQGGLLWVPGGGWGLFVLLFLSLSSLSLSLSLSHTQTHTPLSLIRRSARRPSSTCPRSQCTTAPSPRWASHPPTR